MTALARAPLYARAEQALRARIAAREWKPGEALPTEAALAADMGISQGTLRRALGVLEAQRLIERRQGIGTYVTEATSERALFHFFRAEALDGARITPTSRLHRLESKPARPDEARALRLLKAGRVHRMFRQRFIGGQAAIVEEIALPQAMFPGFRLPLDVELNDELYVHYQRHHGITVIRVAEKLSAIAATTEVAGMLGRAEGAPVLHIARVAFDVMDRPVERRLSWMETGALRYAVELR